VPFCKRDKDKGEVRGASLTTRGAWEEAIPLGSYSGVVVLAEAEKSDKQPSMTVVLPSVLVQSVLYDCSFDRFLLSFVTA